MMDVLNPILQTKMFWITAIVTLIYAYFKLVIYTYWKRQGIPHETPIIPFGNALPLVLGKSSIGNFVKQHYEKSKKYPIFGIYMFHKPMLIINDPEFIQLILVKEFPRFRNRGFYFNEKIDPLSGNLFFLPGERWKHLRSKLTPTFTSGKLKQMFPLLMEIGDELIKTCDSTIEKNNIVELKDLIERYTADSISSVAFGFNCKSLENPDNDFKRYGSMVFDIGPVKNTLGAFAPIFLDIFQIPLMPKVVIQFFSKTVRDMVDYRRQNKIVRNDFLNLLIQLMDKGLLEEDNKSHPTNCTKNDSSVNKISILDVQAQVFIFYLAGFETTSSTLTYCLYELALNPEIQVKLQAEIDEFSKKPGGMTYEIIMNELEYLHMVFSETLRKHPSLPILNRMCTEDYAIPNSNIQIKKGTGIMISVSGIQRDPNIFPDPDKFDPLRFSKENITAENSHAYLAFGQGPRACIGTRFGILQSKIALIGLLLKYNFSVCDKTPIPINYSKRAFTQTPEGGVYLLVEKRKTNQM